MYKKCYRSEKDSNYFNFYYTYNATPKTCKQSFRTVTVFKKSTTYLKVITQGGM